MRRTGGLLVRVDLLSGVGDWVDSIGCVVVGLSACTGCGVGGLGGLLGTVSVGVSTMRSIVADCGLSMIRFRLSILPVDVASNVYDRGSGPMPVIIAGDHVFFAGSW